MTNRRLINILFVVLSLSVAGQIYLFARSC